jgi:outer membrane protein OmpA-like peptidoglycan-associated protein
MRSKPIVLAVVFLLAGLLSGALAFYLQLAPTEPLDAAALVSPPADPKPTQRVARADPPPSLPAIATDLAGPKPDTRQLPAFDIVRIAPSGGVSVLAGRGKPGTFVTISENGKAVGTAEVDTNGEWTLVTEHAFPGGEPKLAVAETARPPLRVATLSATEIRPPVRQDEAPRTSAPPAMPPVMPRVAAVESDLLKNLETAVAAARNETAAPAAPVSAPAPVSSSPVVIAAAPAQALTTATPAAPNASEPLTSYPVPITFVFREATPTESGRKAAALLLEYVRLKGYATLQLSGHADERGSEQFNMQLSKSRLDIVADVLRKGGFRGELVLTPKGRTEPYAGVDRRNFTVDELYQLDRRVELRAAR